MWRETYVHACIDPYAHTRAHIPCSAGHVSPIRAGRPEDNLHGPSSPAADAQARHKSFLCLRKRTWWVWAEKSKSHLTHQFFHLRKWRKKTLLISLLAPTHLQFLGLKVVTDNPFLIRNLKKQRLIPDWLQSSRAPWTRVRFPSMTLTQHISNLYFLQSLHDNFICYEREATYICKHSYTAICFARLKI